MIYRYKALLKDRYTGKHMVMSGILFAPNKDHAIEQMYSQHDNEDYAIEDFEVEDVTGED